MGSTVPLGRLRNVDGKRVQFEDETILEGLKIAEDHPEVAVVNDNYNRWNNLLVDYLVSTEIIDEAMGEVWKNHADHIPFFLGLDGKTTGAIENIMRTELDRPNDFQIINEIVGAGPPKRYRGSEGRKVFNVVDMGGNIIRSLPDRRAAEIFIEDMPEGSGYSIESDMVADLMDPIEAMSKNIMAAITNGLANVAALRSIRDMMDGDHPVAEYVDDPGPSVVTVREKGRDRHVLISDLQMHYALIGGFAGINPVLRILELPVNVLRSWVTRNPGYWARNMNRDSLMTWVFSGVPYWPIANSLKRFGEEALTWAKTGEHTETYKKLESGLAIGGYEQVRSRETPKKLSKILKRGIGKGSKDPVSQVFSSVWNFLGEMGSMSESVTRGEVYEHTYERLREDGVSERRAFGEASRQAMETLNFNR